MTHDYTDEEIQTAWKDALSSREFLDALPDRPQAAEIAALKAELAFLRESESIAPSMQLQRLACEKGNKEAIQEVQKYASTLTVEGINGLLKAIHECLPETQPVLADDGRSLGQVAMTASFDADTDGLTVDECYEAAAQAVAAVVLAQAVRRMEAVQQAEMWKVYKDAPHRIAQKALESVRARLIAAAKGEGQAQPVVVNEPPQSEGQPDLSGESEKQDPRARLKAYAKAGARIRTHDTEWTNDVDWSWCFRPEYYEVHPDDLHLCPEYAPQAEPTQAQP